MSQTFLVTNGDISYGVNGAAQMVSEKPKTRQDVGEMLTISIQPNGFGAGIVDLIGQLSGGMEDGISSNIEFLLREKIEEATERLRQLQRLNNVRNRPYTEQIRSLRYLNVQQMATSKTSFLWNAAFETVDGRLQFLRGRINRAV